MSWPAGAWRADDPWDDIWENQGNANPLIAAVVHAHLEAGADRVCVQAVGVTGLPVREWTELARALDL
jgi:hypothetical protein